MKSQVLEYVSDNIHDLNVQFLLPGQRLQISPTYTMTDILNTGRPEKKVNIHKWHGGWQHYWQAKGTEQLRTLLLAEGVNNEVIAELLQKLGWDQQPE